MSRRLGRHNFVAAAYLVYVGWTMLISGSKKNTPDSIAFDPIFTGATGQNDLNNVFVKGFWTNALNPKVALFLTGLDGQSTFLKPSATN
ncbi:hypothetical protein [Rhodoferax ferrireducens]|uniref:hypothetical protein n=1 Tax=Rhodoferax ferrireducens TaxID=192843 RepID=UPI003BB5BC19